jgi:imidazole glycerol-phosphate synthase subunit HisH
MNKIVIIDYGMGNLRSVQKALNRINIDAFITSDIEKIISADKLILPGVGQFKNAMKKLNDLGLIDVLNRKVIEEKTPVLGICLGMQLFTNHSEEGDCNGLGYVNATTIKFRIEKSNYKIPHIGWNSVSFIKDCLFDDEIYSKESFYFVHSYHVRCNDESDIIGTTDYGYIFTSAIRKNNIIGVQFHPEKSFSAGLSLLKKFCSSYV